MTEELRKRIEKQAKDELFKAQVPRSGQDILTHMYEKGAEAMYELMITAESSTHISTAEAEKSTDMVTSHMGYFSDEGIVK